MIINRSFIYFSFLVFDDGGSYEQSPEFIWDEFIDLIGSI